MSRRILLDDRALAELRAARRWYRRQSTTAAADFVDEVDRALARIAEHPWVYPVRLGPWRQCLLRRFPYFVVFRAIEETVEVVAVAHTSREPLYRADRD